MYIVPLPYHFQIMLILVFFFGGGTRVAYSKLIIVALLNINILNDFYKLFDFLFYNCEIR